jgi:glycosyltransferase involved in cell wall biosynthesis
MNGSQRTLLLIQPTVARYRESLFAQLGDRLAENNISLYIATGGYDRPARQDHGSVHQSRAVPTQTLSVAGVRLVRRRWRQACPSPDLVLVEQAMKNLDAYPLLLRRRFGGPGVAIWGQGRSYSEPQGPLAASAKQFLTRQGQWFFAYTGSGADYVRAHGFPAARISVLNNTIDDQSLRADLTLIDDETIRRFRQIHDLQEGRTALFLGGVDHAKGIDFLLESARLAEAALPGFVLLVAGAGDDLENVRAAHRAGAPVRALGRADGTQRALALTVADVMAIPEWIGLVAVDSLVAERPIVTTWHPSHSAECEYLEPGRTAVFTAHTPSAYADGLVGLLGDRERLTVMQRACSDAAPRYSLHAMVDNFTEGILAWDEVHRAGL